MKIKKIKTAFIYCAMWQENRWRERRALIADKIYIAFHFWLKNKILLNHVSTCSKNHDDRAFIPVALS